ncbi:MAG: metal-dependent transcriptional regulator, partial [Clostridia bacterium]|nr:metal-dependent transcriptional regulator [Clostridia bacterium]
MAEELRESAEDYLESILILSGQKEFVRAADICHYFGYSRPTVS